MSKPGAKRRAGRAERHLQAVITARLLGISAANINIHKRVTLANIAKLHKLIKRFKP